MLNPLSMVRRVVGLGALAAMGLVGAKSWLDEQRAELRHEYYAEQAAFYDLAGLSACQTREMMEAAAKARGWRYQDEPEPVSCTAGAASYLRLMPEPGAPWITKEDGYLVAFDIKGCRIKMTYSGC